MNGWTVPMTPSRVGAKRVRFFKRYKFTSRSEWNLAWLHTEKLVDPMFADSIPIYVGYPKASQSFDPSGYVDFTRFSGLQSCWIRARGGQRPGAVHEAALGAALSEQHNPGLCAR